MKNFNVNRFCIDTVFKALEKKKRKKMKKHKENVSSESDSKLVIEINV